jgi:PAS domain S-box-containing protein
MESVTDYAIFFLDIEGRVAAWNAGCERLFGYTAEEAVGQPCAMLFTPEDREHGVPQREQAMAAAQGRASDTRWHVCKDGSRIWAQGTMTALRDEIDGAGICGYAKVCRDLTELRRGQEALRASERRFRSIIEHGFDAIVLLGADATVQYASPATTGLLGYAPEVIIGRNAFEFMHPDDRSGSTLLFARLLSKPGISQTTTFRCRHQDGSWRWIEGTGTNLLADPDVQAIVANYHDITERKLSEERIRSIVDHALDGIITIDDHGTVETFNPAAQRLFGYQADEVIGRNVKMLMPEPYHSAHDRYIADYLRTGQAKIIGIGREVVGRRKDGSTFPMDLAVSEFHLGEGRHFTGMVRDISERTKLEQELRHRAEELARADRRKDEFLATLAHELRNPLAPICNAVEALRLPPEAAPDVRWASGVLDRQVGLLVRLVDDLLEISRIGQGKVKLHREVVELAAIVADAVETSGPLIEGHRHQLEVTLDSEPLRLEGDRTRLAQVVSNLLTNAAKYTPEGGHIWLRAAREGGEVVLRVRDNGIGIVPEMLPRIFDLFSQGERALHHAQGGLGIGLSLVKGLVEMHGGTVAAHSGGPGQGSEFTLRLPALLDPPGTPPAAEAPQEVAAPKGGSSPSRRILVVEDNVDAAESLALVLRYEGHSVQTAHDAAAALEAARSFHPEVVLLDIGLPGGMTGYDLARQLRQEPGLEKALLIALTGYGQEEDRQRARAAGCDAHLTKPANFDALLAVLAGTPPQQGGPATAGKP